MVYAAALARFGALARYHVADQLHHRGLAGHADVTTLVGVDPVVQRPLGGERVEVGAGDGDVDTRVTGWVAGELRAGHLDAPDGRVAVRRELEPDDQLELAQRRYLVAEPGDRLRDQGPSVAACHAAILGRSVLAARPTV